MYYPTLIRAKNFQSFADLEYKFNNGTTLIINGENFTDEITTEFDDRKFGWE